MSAPEKDHRKTEHEAHLDDTSASDDDNDEADQHVPLRGRPKLQTARINRNALLSFCNKPGLSPPDVRCCDTPNESDCLQDLTSDKIYHLFGNRRFRNYEHFERVLRDASEVLVVAEATVTEEVVDFIRCEIL